MTSVDYTTNTLQDRALQADSLVSQNMKNTADVLDELSTTDSSEEEWHSTVEKIDTGLKNMLDETRSVDGKDSLTHEQKQCVRKLIALSPRHRIELLEHLSMKAIQAVARFQYRDFGTETIGFWKEGGVFKTLTEKKQIVVITENPLILIDIPASHVQSDAVYWAALEISPRIFFFVPSQCRTEKMTWYAVSRDGYVALLLPEEERTVEMDEIALKFARESPDFDAFSEERNCENLCTLRDRFGKVHYVCKLEKPKAFEESNRT
jgi:hypothetical protein